MTADDIIAMEFIQSHSRWKKNEIISGHDPELNQHYKELYATSTKILKALKAPRKGAVCCTGDHESHQVSEAN